MSEHRTYTIDQLFQVQGRIGWKGYTKGDLVDFGPIVIGGHEVKSSLHLNLDDIKHLTWEKYEESPEIMLQHGDVLVVCRGNLADVGFYHDKYGLGTLNPSVVLLRSRGQIDPLYGFYYLSSRVGRSELLSIASGSSVPAIYQSSLKQLQLHIPRINIQQAIAEVLSSLDDKIDLLNRQNETLEAMAQTLFRQWFIEAADDSWEEVPITRIANFLNGLACQKFPPQNVHECLPVLKIRDLKEGISASSDVASSSVDSSCLRIIKKVIFSWSASLVVKLWDGPKCVLNQHLFKVTSDLYPKWYYYFWCKHHLARFIAVANAHATTMGHIKRSDLDNALVVVPDHQELDRMTTILNPVLEKLELNSTQISSLRKQRDTLLPKLMSGEVRVKLD